MLLCCYYAALTVSWAHGSADIGKLTSVVEVDVIAGVRPTSC